jgi:endonuclease YncB( thermonuclease family)
MRSFAIAAILALAAWPAGAQNPCKASFLGTAQATAVRDGRTVLLADGHELRLAAVETADGSGAVLEGLIGGRPLRLEGQGAESDRYGRLVAFAFAGDDEQSLQQRLVEAGAARMSARVGNKACAKALLAAEREARAARRGLWADPNFAPLTPQDRDRLRAERGHFAIVEGKVLSVRVSGSTIYVNFGRRWTRDFSVMIPRRNQRIFNEAGLEPGGLQGRRVRVRGWLGLRRGPVIEADRPEQIEFADVTMTNAREARP